MKVKLFCWLLGLSLSCSTQAMPTQAMAEKVVAEGNVRSLQIYDQVKAKYAEQTDPLIIAWGDHLSFYHQQHWQQLPIVSEEYIDLKSIGHVVLATFALFNRENHFPDNIDVVKNYKEQVVKTLQVVDALPLTAVQKNRQKIILKKTNIFLEQAISKKAVKQIDVTNFFADLSPEILQNMSDAASSQISLLNQQMTKIQQQLTRAEKNKLFVVLPGFKMPRRENIIGQYFSKYLNAPMDSQRLIYAEGLTDVNSILTLVGTWQFESLLAEQFFHNPERMKKDLLADNAENYLQHCQVDPSGKQALICGS